MTGNSESFFAIEELLLAVEVSEQTDVTLVKAEATVDLSEFNLSQQEIEKFTKIFRKLNAQLSESLQESCPAVSVFSEIRCLE